MNGKDILIRIADKCISSPGGRPGRVVAMLPKALRDKLKALKSEDLTKLRPDAILKSPAERR